MIVVTTVMKMHVIIVWIEHVELTSSVVSLVFVLEIQPNASEKD